MDKVDLINQECERIHAMSWSRACHILRAATFSRHIERGLIDVARRVVADVDRVAVEIERRARADAA